MLDARTKLCCLIGYPVDSSASPSMANAAFRRMGLNLVYLSFSIRPAALGQAVEGLRAVDVRGFNVTMPHKTSVIKYLDGMDDLTLDSGAVNTAVNQNGRLLGYNTDVTAVMSLVGKGSVDTLAVVIGAGGAARACVTALAHLGFGSVTIVNRTASNASSMASELGRRLGLRISCLPLSDPGLVKHVSRASLVVNATPIGSYMSPDESPLGPKAFREGMTVLDMVYNPVRTRFVREAAQAGAGTISGCDMLVEQAAASITLWTGLAPPKRDMKAAALRFLRGVRHEGKGHL